MKSFNCEVLIDHGDSESIFKQELEDMCPGQGAMRPSIFPIVKNLSLEKENQLTI